VYGRRKKWPAKEKKSTVSRERRREESMAHLAEIRLPGSFVVFQGIAGDGLWNTIDSVPILEEEEEEEFHHVEESSYEEEEAPQPQTQPLARSPLSTFDPMLAHQTSMPSLSLNPLLTSTRTIRPTQPDDSFIVVSDTEQPTEGRRRAEVERAIDAWYDTCRSREQRQCHDYGQQQRWWQVGGRLAIFKELPTFTNDGRLIDDDTSITACLSPGSTVVASKMIHLNSSDTLLQQPSHDQGSLRLLKLESPQEGYVVYNVGAYCFLGPGLPCMYVEPDDWTWRVTCRDGAVVRQGLALHDRHVATLPYGSLLKVTRKTVNNEGLNRLHITAAAAAAALGVVSGGEGEMLVEGWISEFLNPKCGQRGPIAQPLPFPVPALYKVILKDGAVIRSDVELCSAEIGHAPKGTIVTIVGRAFSEHPQDYCVERLKLAGNGGWVSARLNRPSPHDDLVFELVDIEGRFDPDDAGKFHLQAQQQSVERSSAENMDLSSIDEDASVHSVTRVTLLPGVPPNLRTAEGCLICHDAERNATIVHGETGHIACCLVCARILKAQEHAVVSYVYMHMHLLSRVCVLYN
jgi:hypothetical protein